MKFILKLTIISLSVFIFSCGGNKFNEEQVSNLILNKNSGILAGINIGDDWEIVKQNAPNDWTIVDTIMVEGDYQSEHQQLIIPREHNSHRMALTFGLDDNGIIENIEFFLNGEAGDESMIEKYYSKITDEFNNKFESDEFHKWKYESPNGKLFTIMLNIDVSGEFDPSVGFFLIKK